MYTNTKKKEKVGLFKIIMIIILCSLGSLVLGLSAVISDIIISWIQKLLFVNGDIILLVSGSFISRVDGIIIVSIPMATIAAFYFKYIKKKKFIVIISILWIGMCLGTVLTYTIFNNNSIVSRSINHISSISYKYSDVKEVQIYYTEEYGGNSPSFKIHYEFKMNDGNNINIVSGKGGDDFKTNFSKYVQLEKKVKNVPHLVDNSFIDRYGHLFPIDYFKSFKVL